MRCSYCGDGPYKDELIDYDKGMGGYINDYWFCQWCLEYGKKESTDSEKERWQKLVKEAKNNS